MSRFDISVQDLFADDLDDRVASQITRGARQATTRMAGDRSNPMGVTMFTLSEILMKAPGYNSLEDVLVGQEGILAGLFAGIYGGNAKEALPGLEHIVPADLLELAEGTQFGASPDVIGDDGGGGGEAGPYDPGDPNATGSYNLGPVKPWVKAAAHEVGPRFGVKTIHGVAARSNKSEHPIGRALDFMVSRGKASGANKERGDKITAYLMANHQRLRVMYLMWWHRKWNPGRDGQGPYMQVSRMVEERGNATANHYDHVHVSFLASG